MVRPLRIHPEAIEEAREARCWYAERSVPAAADFLHELQSAYQAIAEYPERFSLSLM